MLVIAERLLITDVLKSWPGAKKQDQYQQQQRSPATFSLSGLVGLYTLQIQVSVNHIL